MPNQWQVVWVGGVDGEAATDFIVNCSEDGVVCSDVFEEEGLI